MLAVNVVFLIISFSGSKSMLCASTHSLDPCLWGGGGSDCPAFGPPASISLHLACNYIMVWLLQRGHSGDGCDLASTLCMYDLRKGDLFVLSWARV